MTTTEYRQTAARLLDAHGFIHETGDMWLNAGLTQWATAGVDCDDPTKLQLMVFNFSNYEMEYQTLIDLATINDDVIEHVLQPFDLT